MRIVRRHYKGVSKNYGLIMWNTTGYLAFDFYFGKHLFVLGFAVKDN